MPKVWSTFDSYTSIDQVLSAQERARKLRDTIQNHLSDNRRGEIIRSGIRLTIFGPPNAGKSSLLNFLGKSYPNPMLLDLTWLSSSSKRSGNSHSSPRYNQRHPRTVARYRWFTCHRD